MDEFFKFARERHSIYLRRRRGDPYPWTKDRVLQTGRFTNVFRELDRTTAWFRENVREPLRSQPEVLLATVVFRWFNRTTTGEAIFLQPYLTTGMTAFETFRATCDVGHLRSAILTFLPKKGPYVTGAYTINTRSAGLGLTKLDGVLRLIDMWMERHQDWRHVAEALIEGDGQGSMADFCAWCTSPCLAGFMTYEVACDLRHTDLLQNAHDRLCWANPGPGAVRGLNRIHDRPVGKSLRAAQAVEEMAELLEQSRNGRYWPQLRNRLYMMEGVGSLGCVGRMELQNYNTVPVAWPRWEMREVEHTLCEYDKWCRVTEGAGQTRGKFSVPH
jgi:hypothetical protein